ncbi:hypothetical protein HYT25_00120 [Candidatus Pacearchaeota archaeon]|nr:hypothetical protein [Candidatus Pacearchaeota archaeon]
MKTKNQIHEKIRKRSPKGIKKAKKLFSFKYPKLMILIASIVLSYFIFTNQGIYGYVSHLQVGGYLGVFLSGILLSFGFTAAFGVGFLIAANPSNIFLASIIGGIGGIAADLLIFKFIKMSFQKEFDEIKKTKAMLGIEKMIQNNTPVLFKHYLLYIFSGIFIASPLPDEIGISMFAGLSSIDARKLAILSFIFHFLGILAILYLGSFV